MGPLSDLRLTEEQSSVVDEDRRHVCVTGAAGTGKTAALVARYVRLVAGPPRPGGEEPQPASRVLVICRNRGAADRFRDAVLPQLAGGFDSLPITTITGLAFDLVRRHRGEVELLTGAEQHELVMRLLATDGPGEWPTLDHLRGRAAFAREVRAAVGTRRASLLDDDEVRSRAAAADALERWNELLAFAGRYQAALDDARALDHAGLLVAAADLLDQPAVRETERGRFAHVLVDDHETAAPVTNRILAALAGLGAVVVAAGNPAAAIPSTDPADAPLAALATDLQALDVTLTIPFRRTPPPVLMRCGHPAVEPEAVAGLLLRAHAEGVAWRDMAVLVRGPGGRARGIGRALARHGVPTAAMTAVADDEPTVRAVVDALRWAGGDRAALERLLTSPVTGIEPAELRSDRPEAADSGIPVEDHPRLADLARLINDLRHRAPHESPAELAFEVWQRTLGPAAGTSESNDDRALDAMVAFHDGLRRRAERRPQERLREFLAVAGPELIAPDPWSQAAAPWPGAVTITSIAASAGREWHTVVVADCVEGELPRVHAQPKLFDRAVLQHARPTTAPERLRHSLNDERRLFAIASSRATGRLVASAAPEPGVLLSRFVEDWPELAPELPLAPGPPSVSRAPTAGATPVHPDPSLRLSASQLRTYDDCPLRYAYEYVLGARDEPGVRADLGSLVHEVLATFLDPSPGGPERPVRAGGDVPLDVPRTCEGLLELGERLWREDIAPYRPQVEEARRDYFAMLDAWWDGEGCQIAARTDGADDAPLAAEVLAVERRFEVDVGPHRVRGAIDRVDRADDGTGIRIVDYKTGKAEPRAPDVAYDLQLAIYHLAASRDPELAALGPPTQLRLVYLRSMHGYEQEVATDHAARTEAAVLDRADLIRAEQFDPSVDATCRTCSCQRICPLHDEGRNVS